MEDSNGNPVVKRSFLVEETEYDVIAKTSHAVLYEAYTKWCKENGILLTVSTNKFSRNLMILDRQGKIKKTHDHNGRVFWIGIKLKNHPTETESEFPM